MTLARFRGRCHTCGHDHDMDDLLFREALKAPVAEEKTPKGLNGWVMPSILPDTDREVLMLMRMRGTMSQRERIQIGYYSHGQSWWRPRGSNGDFSDEVQGWRELPSIDGPHGT